MADNEFKYRLTFESTATGTGAVQTVDALQAVEKATQKVADATKRSVREYDSSADKAKVTEFAFYDLDAAMKQTANQTVTLTNGNTQLERSTRNNAQALLMFSQGFEDAQYGIRGVLNNIPGLVIAMGGGAGLAGAISIAAVGLSQIIPLFQKTKESAGDLEERMEGIVNAIGEVESDRIAEADAAIASAAASAEALKQNWDDTRAAESNYSLTALSNAEKLQQAQNLIAEALGLQVDRFRELELIAARQAEERRLKAEAALLAERQKLETADEEIQKSAENLRALQQRKVDEEVILVRLRAQLESLREQRDVLEAYASGRANFNDPLPAGLESLEAFKNEQRGRAGSFQRYRAVVGDRARQMLENPDFTGALSIAEERIARVEDALQSLTETNGRIENAATALQAAQTRAADVAAAVETNIQSIEESLAADDLVARAQRLAQSGEELARGIGEAAGKVTTTTAEGLAAKQTIEAATEDGRITAQESAALGASLRTLIGQMQSGLATSNQNVGVLIELQRQFAAISQQQAAEIQSLRSQIQSLQQRR